MYEKNKRRKIYMYKVIPAEGFIAAKQQAINNTDPYGANVILIASSCQDLRVLIRISRDVRSTQMFNDPLSHERDLH